MTEQLPLSAITVGKRRRHRNDVSELSESIARLGLLHPITVTTEHRLIAGFHRLEACRALGWTEIPAVVLSCDALDAELAEIDENLIRNDLTVLERSEHLARRKAIYEARHPETRKGNTTERAIVKRNNSALLPSFSVDAAAKTGTSVSTVQHEVQIARKLADDVKDAIRDHPVADSKQGLLAMSRLPQDEQRAVAEKLVSGEAKNVRQARKRVTADRIRQEPEPLPDGPFRVIAIDPPWAYQNRTDEQDHRGAGDYPEMTTAQIAALDIPALAAPDCILWLWTTNAHLRDAFTVLDAWGFQQKTVLTWVKSHFGVGDWLRGQTEHCLMAVLGQPVVVLTNQSTVLSGAVREHSRKPDEFFALVESLCPGSKVELFAREQRPGWTCWGGEKELFDAER